MHINEANTEVKAWVEKMIIPTYAAGEPEKNPMFLEKRVYQGSSGVVYPLPVIESISNKKTQKEYTAVFLENAYLKIMILPELGGRIQRAYDKIRNRDFVYYNEVIKPALVGLAGPWISGGIEFNWPQHHRPSTFSPIDYTIEENADGSKTVWVNETEIMFRTRGMAGFTLYPGKAYLEVKGKLFNRTPFPQTFLWWANPAVKVNEHYQSVFPPDVYAVFDHGKRDVSDFPVATGTYYKVDYSPGTDISRYHTIPVPTSYMAIRSKYDFIGCFEHDTQAGMLHVASHHYSPGKKQWTWGNGDFGFAWDRNLTDENGPYIELMTGVFTDNQPDFSWLQPNEGKTFEQYFMPYSHIGIVKNATKEALLNVEFTNSNILVKVYTTAVYKNATIQLFKEGNLMKQYDCNLSPVESLHEVYNTGSSVTQQDHWKVTVTDTDGNELVSYQAEPVVKKEIPAAATAAKLPAEIEQVEELYLNGLHLEQYRHATFNPVDYYTEGLRRSPGDIRCNNAMGLLLLRRGQFIQAEPYFRKAIETATLRNPNSYDGEAYYNLGWSLKLQGKLSPAFDAFYKATWNDAWQHSSFFALARIDTEQKKWKDALELIEKSLIRNYHSHQVRHLKAALLRITGQFTEALALIAESLKIDPFNYGCLFETILIYEALNNEKEALATMHKLATLMRGSENNYLELSLDYVQAGLYNEAHWVLQTFTAKHTKVTPLVYYYTGWLLMQLGERKEALKDYQKAAAMDTAFCFPNKIEEVLIFGSALLHNPSDGKANYYLGNLWYDKRQYQEAIACWQQCITAGSVFPTVFRNLSLAYYNKLGKKEEALEYLEKAFALDRKDARILMELDQLYKITGKGFEERLSLLDSYNELVEKRDDLYLEKIILHNNLLQFTEAKQLLAVRKFHPWEGGEGKVVGQYLLCHLQLAKQAIQNQEYQQALQLLTDMGHYPENLGEGKLYGATENDRHYWTGYVCEKMGLQEKAMQCFKLATAGAGEPVQAVYYNDPQPDKFIYQALAWIKLGQQSKAKQLFERFIQFGEKHLHDKVNIDYFAVSLPDMLVFDSDINKNNSIHCHYLIGLGWLGLGEQTLAKQYLNKVLELDINHQGAMVYLQMLSYWGQMILSPAEPV